MEKWNSTQRDPLPVDGETVIVSDNGVYYLCVFDAIGGYFRTKVEIQPKSFSTRSKNLYWMRMPEDFSGEAAE
jgi:hypothetical protein